MKICNPVSFPFLFFYHMLLLITNIFYYDYDHTVLGHILHKNKIGVGEHLYIQKTSFFLKKQEIKVRKENNVYL